jgi:poly(3-hydroxybutyrate) depolymerase
MTQISSSLFLCLSLFALATATIGQGVNNGRVSEAMLRWRDGAKVAPGQASYTIQRPEGTRTFYVWVPKSYDGSAAFPVIFSFHGLGDTCLDFGPETGLQSLSETYNFLYVYPCGYPGLIGNAWNAGTCCLNPSSIDDVAFTREMLNTLNSNYHVNSSRVFASGFSNGAMMAEILGCEAADIFQATASVSGVVELVPGNSAGLAACSTSYASRSQRVSTVNIHGDLDFVVPWTGDALLGFPDIPTNFQDWAVRNQCKGNPVVTFQKAQYTESTYLDCAGKTTVRLVKNEGGGHEWPSDSNFDTATYIVNFFFNSTQIE